MRVFGYIMLVLLLIATASAGGWAIRYYTAAPKGIITAQEQIQSAPSRIGAYNYFFDLCSAIQANEVQLDALYAEREVVTTDRNRSRVNASITGVTAERGRGIARYNTDARKDYTIGQFRDSNLPYQLPVTEYKVGGRTSCGTG